MLLHPACHVVLAVKVGAHLRCAGDLGLGAPELGWVSLRELATVRGRLGLPVERDLHFRAEKRLSAYARNARLAGRIVV